MKQGRAMVLCLLLLLLTGCAQRIDNSLPTDPQEFHAGTFRNPTDKTDEYLSLEYNGRVYIPYGGLAGSINGSNVDRCVGYYVQDAKKMEDVRIFLLAEDPEANFLLRMDTVGVMNQPDFFRAVDTKGKDIAVPRYIDPSDMPFWNS